MTARIRIATILVAALATTAQAQETLPPGSRVVRIEANLPAIALKNPYEYAQLLLTGQLDTGERVDVTRMATLQKPMGLVNVSPAGLVRPVADGSGELKCSVGDQTVSVPVTVTGQKEKVTVSFVRDVMPMMSRLGCNAGTCHGAQAGKNGFKLSLRGYDPLHDHLALTDDLEGRRFNRAAPDTSLMLLKPSGGAPHVGGVVIKPGEPPYELLRAWIASGVKLDLNSPRVARIEVFPKNPVLPLPGMKQQTRVLATFTDGGVRDVTAEAFVESSNNEVALADKQGLVTAVRRGETAVMVRYEGAYAATSLIVMGDRSGFTWHDVPELNWIDALVDEKLKSVRVQPSDLCTDGEFVRRLTLDLTGLPPTPEELRKFLADPRPSKVKRDELIDKLVGSPEYIEHWTNKWADLLQVNRKFLGEQGAKALREWIRNAVATNMPYDKLAYTVLTASGSTLDNPPAAYYKVLRDPGAAMENTTQLFLAVRFNCNKCHDHPFERWTQDQYYQLSAYFAQVERKEDPKFKGQKVGGSAVEGATPLVEDIADAKAGDVKHERTGAVTAPVFPYQPELAPKTGTRRELLARWATSPQNQYFAKSYVNRLWSYLLGAGLIEPVDDIRAGNPASNPKLLERLTKEFIDSGFNTQQMMRAICKSATYQRSLVTNRWNADDAINYSHALARRLPAEVLFDSIYRVIGSQTHLPGVPAGTRAVQLVDSQVEVPGGFLDLFGRPPRESACECERTSSMMLAPVLNLANGPVLADALKDPGNRLSLLMAHEKDDARVVEELFLAVLCRPPTARELAASVAELRGHRDEYARIAEEHAKLETALGDYEKQVPAKQADWEKKLQQGTAWTVLRPTSAHATGGAKLATEGDGSLLATGKNPFPEVYTVTTDLHQTGITGIRLEAMADPRLPGNGPGRAPNGNFVVHEFRVAAMAKSELKKVPYLVGTTAGLLATPLGRGPFFVAGLLRTEQLVPQVRPVALHKAAADFSQDGFAIAAAIDGNPETGWAIVPQTGKSHTAVFETKEPLLAAEGTVLLFTLEQNYKGKEHNLGRFRLSATTSKGPIRFDGPPEEIALALAVAPDKRTKEQQATLSNAYRGLDQELARLQRAVAEHYKPADPRMIGAQDLVWSMINTPAFLFNH